MCRNHHGSGYILILAGVLLGLCCPSALAADEKVNLRQMNILDTQTVIRLWDTVDEYGQATPWYQIVRAGKTVTRQTSYQIKLRHGNFDPLASVPPPLFEALGSSPDQEIFIVQFQTQTLDEYRAAIIELGGEVYKFLPNHAHLVKMDSAVRQAVEALPFVRWVGPYHPAYRMEEYLLHHSDSPGDYYPLQKYNISVFEAGSYHKNTVAQRIRKMGGTVEREHAGKYLLEAILTPEQLFEVVTWDEVLFVDRWSPMEKDMDIAREYGGANYIEMVEGFTGQGVRGEIIDAGFNLDHVDFASRPLILHTPVSVDSHGAATSGINFGDGTGNPAARGMLPDGQGIVADWSEVSVGTPRYDHTGELVQAPYFAVFQTASVGSNRTLNYTNISMDTDAALFDFDIVHCQSQSNAGDQMSRPQAWAKNIISGGAVNHQGTLDRSDDCWCGGASIGPATDGRIKPDLNSFYDGILTTTTGGPTAYTSGFGGTSGATPIICGHVGLLFQMWSEGVFGNEVDPNGTVFDNRCHMTTAKALLINSASQYPFSGAGHDLTRVHQGWGSPNLQTLYDRRERTVIIDESVVLSNLETHTESVYVFADEPQFQATLVFADPPGTPGASQHRINDLTLKVTDPNGLIYYGNNGLLEGNYSTSGGDPSDIDTVENVIVANPPVGQWVVEVIAAEINEDSHVETPATDADFALVISGALQGPGFFMQAGDLNAEICAPDDFTVQLDLLEVPPFAETVTLSADLPAGASVSFSNNPVTIPGSTMVTISGLAGVAPGTHPYTISGTAPSFTKSISGNLTISNAIPAQPGNLTPSNGAVEVSRIPTFSWDAIAQTLEYSYELATDENFTDVIFSGTTTDTSVIFNSTLASLTQYFWRVRAINTCGDSSWSVVHCFTTLEQADYFTQQFTSNFDLEGMTLSFIPDGTGDYYFACSEVAGALPTDPTGGDVLPLSDDDNEQVTLAVPVKLYGVDYGSFFVGSNGFITFNSGSNDTSESISEHFSQPRISGFYDDLNPAQGGSVIFKETADRATVTFENVPEYNAGNSNTFQIEMLHNGEIHITYLGMDGNDCVAGISAGGGQPGDFFPSDLSSYGSCDAFVYTRGGPSCAAPCSGDLNGDLSIDLTDLGICLASWPDVIQGGEDLNGDGSLNVIDMTMLTNLLGNSCD